ncbi:hypothetical protein Acr_26g0009870 [Actinidia rufa]|uniref:Disease resistance R13L4/SHOC-2-like LRR domain-containing protein n=1 Tax=Actinidia rufa TaxID=165716 RepID=A0A7J0H3N8_9ERIC|nr:hypothetical protein Acr_26g0009870 [Actinidia rufa]
MEISVPFSSFDAREGPDPGEDVGNFLRRGIARGCFKRLNVIDLEGVFQPRLPESLGKIVELRLINLRKLGLMCQLTSSQQKPPAKWIAKLNHLESLRLKSIDEMVQPSDLYLEPLSSLKNLSSIYLLGRLGNPIVVDNLPESLTEITLSLSELTENPMPKLGKLRNLRILNLFAKFNTGKNMVCSSDSFPLLRVLNIWKLEELEEWIVEEGALTILKELEIRSCNKLKMIPDGLQHLVHCSELKLTKMPNEFNERVTEYWSKVAHGLSIIIKD